MWMNDDEIVSSYLHAADQTKQVQILSELNACSKDAIIKVLQGSPRIHNKIVGGGVFLKRIVITLRNWWNYSKRKSGMPISYA